MFCSLTLTKINNTSPHNNNRKLVPRRKHIPPPQRTATPSKRSALKNARILTKNPQPNAGNDLHDDSGDIEELGGMPDRDECEGPEMEHAVNSPVKNGRRLDLKVCGILLLSLLANSKHLDNGQG